MRTSRTASSLLGLVMLLQWAGCDTAALTDGTPVTVDDLAMAPAPQPDLASPPLSPGPDLAAPPKDWCSPTDPRTPAVTVFPTPESGEAPYVDALVKATRTIRVNVYLMGAGAILDTLIAKAKAGVDEKIILDVSQQGTNQKYFDQLAAAGAHMAWSDPKFTYCHSKYFVVDEAEAVISTGNYSKSFSILLERNYVGRDTDPADVADLIALFDADWSHASPDLGCTRLVVSPVNSRQRIVALIDSATTSLQIESMQFADTDIRTAVAKRKAAGVDVRVLLAEASWISANADGAAYLKNLAIPVRSIPHLHTKMLIVDGKQAYFGSENFSYTSLNKNREVGLIVVEPESLKPLAATFEKDWAVGKAF